MWYTETKGVKRAGKGVTCTMGVSIMGTADAFKATDL